MANEITFGYLSGATLTYGAYQPSGTVRTAAGTSLPEIGATGYYTATDAAIVAGDFVIVKEGTVIVGQGQYKPEVVSSSISSDLADIESQLSILATNAGKVNNSREEQNVEIETTKARIYI